MIGVHVLGGASAEWRADHDAHPAEATCGICVGERRGGETVHLSAHLSLLSM